MMRKHSRILSLLLCSLLIVTSLMPVFGENATPNDYGSHWAKDTISAAVASGLMKGYPDGTFKPDNRITRAEFFALINQGFNLTAETTADYSDVPKDAWYAPVMAKAASAGYISGYEDGTIRPEASISRQEAAVIISRLKAFPAGVTTPAFTDTAKIAPWSKNAIFAALDAKIMTGYPDGSFRPEAPIKRAEALVVLNKSVPRTAAPVTTYDKPGVYGPATGSTVIDGNVVISAPGITLQNTSIKGNLTIAKTVGTGDATLKNVVISGNTYVNGGGVNSIYFVDVTTGKVYVVKDDGPVRIVVSGASAIKEVEAASGVKLEEVSLTGAGLEGISVSKKTEGNIEITLTGVTCKTFDIKSEGVTLISDKASSIETLSVDAKGVQVRGAGAVKHAVINHSDASFESAPKSVSIAPGVKEPLIKPAKPAAGGGGGSGNSNGDLAYAAAPASVTLELENPSLPFIVTNVAIPAPGGTDRTGLIAYDSSAPSKQSEKMSAFSEAAADPVRADGSPTKKGLFNIFFKVKDSGTAKSSIKINDAAYTNGDPYSLINGKVLLSELRVVVTTEESGKKTAIRTFVVPIDGGALLDESGFIVRTSLGGVPVPINQEFSILLSAATDKDGLVLSGDKRVRISGLSGDNTPLVLYDNTATFISGAATLSQMTLVSAEKYNLTVTVEGVTRPEELTLISYTQEGPWKYTVADKGAQIIGYTDADTNPSPVIPASLGGGTVTSIGDSAFYRSKIQSVTIPSSVTAIGSFAFYDCTKLSSITIPDGVTTIKDGTFSACSGLKFVNLGSGVTEIMNSAFYGCYNLKSFTFPASVKKIADSAFESAHLLAAYFKGNAPQLGLKKTPFGTISSPVIYYTSDATGFSSPLWEDIPSEVLLNTTPSATLNMVGRKPALGNLADNTDYSLDGGITWTTGSAIDSSRILEISDTFINSVDDIKVRVNNDETNIQTIDILPGLQTPSFTVDPVKDLIQGLEPLAFYKVTTQNASGARRASKEGTINFTIDDYDLIQLSRLSHHNQPGPIKCVNLDTATPQTTSIMLIMNSSPTVRTPFRVEPEIAPNTASRIFNYSVENGTGSAVVAQTGQIIPIYSGTIVVKVHTTDGSNLTGTLALTIVD